MEDKIVVIIIIAVCILPLVIFGIIFLNGKGTSLIAGFNAKTEEEKSQYDTVALCKFLGKMMFLLSFSMLFWIISVAYEEILFFIFGIALFINIVVFMIVYMNTGNRFKKL